MSKRDLTMIITHGEWEDMQAEVERRQKLCEQMEKDVMELRDKWFVEMTHTLNQWTLKND